MSMAATELVSIIIPAYNEAPNLPELYKRLSATIDPIVEYKFEIIFIDNCSSDNTYDLACNYANQDPRWACYRMSRNFGAEASLAAGLSLAQGAAGIFLYSDLQEPPELIPTLLEKWKEGYDVVYGQVDKRADDKFYKYIGAKICYAIIDLLSDVKLPIGATDYRLMSRKCIDVLTKCNEKSRYLRGLVHWIGFKQVAVRYSRDTRTKGRSSTNLPFLISYAINAIICFSSKPLVLASVVGVVSTFSSILLGVLYCLLAYLSARGLISLVPPPIGWTTQTLLIIFFGGLNCFFLGVIGSYTAKIYDETKNRPTWVIAESSVRKGP